MTNAWEMWRGGTRGLDLNPKTGDWPGLPFYLTLGLQLTYRAYDWIAHGGASAESFARRVETDPAGLFLFARIFSALIGVLTIYLTWRLGSRLAGKHVGFIAASLLALSPVHILASQRVSDPNLLALLFVLLATERLVGPERSPGMRSSVIAGAMIGLAGACKYVPLALTGVLALAHVERVEGASRGRLRVRWRHLAASLLATAIAFSIASPYTLLDWSAKSQDLRLQRGRLLSEWVGLSESSVSLPTYLARTLPHMLGWPAYLLAIAGSFLLLAHRPKGWIVALIPVALVIPTGLFGVAQERFMVPALGSLAVAAAYAVVRFASRVSKPAAAPSAKGGRVAAAPKRRAATAVALCVLIAASIAWTAPEYLRARQALRMPDTRRLARKWIEATIPRSEPIAVDVYGPEFNPEADRRLALIWPFLAAQAAYVRVAYHPEWLDGLSYYVTSEEIERRFAAASERYPAEAGFHRWIQSHATRVWRTDSKAASGPRIDVWALPERISTREERERLWSEARGQPMYEARLARWCRDMASAFLKRDRYARAEEWSARGLTIPGPGYRKDLFETLSLAEVRSGKPSEAVQVSRAALTEFPDSPLLHLNCAVALEALSRREEAIAEYRASLRLSSNEEAVRLIRAQLARLGQ